MKTLAVFLVLIATGNLCGAQQADASKTAILSGLQKATVIVSGTSQGSATGGGGVSTQLKVDEVFVGEPSLRGKVITVFWLYGKTNERGKSIWFLTPHSQGYQETTGTNYSFVEATDENIGFLLSRIESKKEPNQTFQGTRLTPPSARDDQRVADIREIAQRWWFRNRGLLAEESLKVAGYFRVVRPISAFAERDDRVWEVRVVHMEGSPTGVLWINDKTGKVTGLGLPAQGETEPAAGAAPARPGPAQP